MAKTVNAWVLLLQTIIRNDVLSSKGSECFLRGLFFGPQETQNEPFPKKGLDF